jgi:hypothetical protein
MQVRVQMQILTPGVQHRKEADGCAEQSRVGRSFEQGLGSGSEQDVVNLFRVLKRQTADLLRHGKHHVEIGNGQKLCLLLLEPTSAGSGLALGTVPVSARVA